MWSYSIAFVSRVISLVFFSFPFSIFFFLRFLCVPGYLSCWRSTPWPTKKKKRNHKPDRIYLKICEHIYIESIQMICWKYTYVALCAWTHSIEQPQAQNHSTPHCTTHVLCKITRLIFKTWLFTLYSVLHTSTHSPLSTPDCTLPSPHFTLYTE